MKEIHKEVVGDITIVMRRYDVDDGYEVETRYDGKRLRLYECEDVKEAEYTFNTIRDTIEDCEKVSGK